jgi:hypothetical protein
MMIIPPPHLATFRDAAMGSLKNAFVAALKGTGQNIIPRKESLTKLM